ncbi:MAG: RNA polymerase sigma factor [Planctomycetales bacterium]|nr:RNA polymerase sigma factor [Planctomycetales bacterium]
MASPREEKVSDAGQGSPSAMDPEQFAAQYRQAYPRLHLVATGIIGDRTHAHDIVQEAAVIALEKSNRFIAGSSYVAWLSEIVRRCSLNYASKVRGRRTSAADPDLLAQTAQGNASPPKNWPISSKTGELVESQTDFDDELLGALKEISTESRCCLLLRVVQSLSYAEIAELMQIPEGTAMSYVHRSKRQIRRILEQRAEIARIEEETS